MATPIIPQGPWTVEALGDKQYQELSVAYGCGFDSSFRPALDLTKAYAEQQNGADTKKTEGQKAAPADNKEGGN